ncbi:guanine deaminase [Variibacter gotjawalensis]|uniref:Guanine deaminase n=1 Tax=Variibacter gotjawalensis TaxID=1333996 RepID=A0A0S3PRL7_9BRAD|nr:nucleoside deaminase [Variibacter gotjawalensis]NIK48802.1 tRNA(Arg) A34 adenosine deaminase TadA [Variibacter gotjawalensis]RZS50663.1 tRNA(Arg) A34 adenosine deaminase TadA [Variibacter gotjawalensis]BAT58496.1 guanine deaminase [Variibacter gotjawalensis]
MVSETDLIHLKRCIALAEESLDAGDKPFGSVLVSAEGRVLQEDRNRTGGGDNTQHPEFALARWAANNMTPQARSAATVYTSGEHCAMCSAAHGWVGLGRIVYVASSAQHRGWLAEWGIQPGPVKAIPIQDVAPNVPVEGPVTELTDTIRAVHKRYFDKER